MRDRRLLVGLLCATVACGNSLNTSPDLAVTVDDGGGGGDASMVDATVVPPVDATVSSVDRYVALPTGRTLITVDHGSSPRMTLEDTVRVFTVQGTYQTLASGFFKVTISAGCDGAGCTPTSAGSNQLPNGVTVHGVEARGHFIYVQPDAGGGPVLGVGEDACSAGMFRTYNIVNAALPPTTNLTTSPAYAVATVGGTASAVSISGSNFRLDGTTVGAFTLPSTACTNGVTLFNGVGTLQASGTGFGFFLPTTGGGAVGFAQSGITLAELQNRDYRGYLLQNTGGGGDAGAPTFTDQPVGVTFGNGPTGNGAPYTDVDNNVLAATTGVLTLGAISNGLVSGTLTTPNGPGNYRASVWKAPSGQVFLIAVGGNSANTSPFNLILVSR